MPRHPRQQSSTGAYHFITRGVNKKQLFHKRQDYEYYRKLLLEYSQKLLIHIHHYCFMPNHTHLLVRSKDIGSLSRFGHFVQRRYAYYYCKTYHWPEQVFRKRFISLPVEEDIYLLECGRYVERNPLNAKLVKDPKDYPHTSYPYYAYHKPDFLITESPVYSTLGATQRERMAVYRCYVVQPRQKEELIPASL